MAETDTLTSTGTATTTLQAAPDANPLAASVSTSAKDYWRTGLPEDIREDQALAQFKDVGALAKSYLATKRMVGEKIPEGLTVEQVHDYLRGAVRIPSKDSTPQEWADYNKKLGVPESPGDYAKIVQFPKLPEGAPEWHAPTIESFYQVAHKNGATPQLVNAFVQWYAADQLAKRDQTSAQSSTAHKAELAKAQAALEEEWGPKGSPTYERNVGLARASVRHLFGNDPTMAEWAEGQGNHPAFVKGLAKIGAQMLEDELIDGDFTPAPDNATLDGQIREARAVLSKLNPGSRDYTSAKAHMDSLYQQRYARGK